MKDTIRELIETITQLTDSGLLEWERGPDPCTYKTKGFPQAQVIIRMDREENYSITVTNHNGGYVLNNHIDDSLLQPLYEKLSTQVGRSSLEQVIKDFKARLKRGQK